MKDQITIQIPFSLAFYAVQQRQKVNAYDTNQVIKALDTWLILKAEAPGSFIQDWNKQKDYLLKICKVSETIFRHRLQLLKKMQLLQVCRQHIRLCSWVTMEKLLCIDCSKKLKVVYDINNKQRMQEWIIAAEIADNQSRQAYMILKKVEKIPGRKEVLKEAMIRQGADSNRLATDPDYFLAMLKSLYLQDFVQATDIHTELIEVRPDTNRGVRSMAATWNAKHPMTASYWKSILQKSGIIDISKLQVESTTRTRNEFCRVLWLNTKRIRQHWPDRKRLQTLLCLCDQITVLQPWTIKNFLLAA